MDIITFLQGDSLQVGISLAMFGPWPIVAAGLAFLGIVVLRSR